VAVICKQDLGRRGQAANQSFSELGSVSVGEADLMRMNLGSFILQTSKSKINI
jgi:hypothetical protein